MGNKVNSVFAPDMRRFVSSLEVGHACKCLLTALSWGHLLRWLASLTTGAETREAEMFKNKVNLYFPAAWKRFWRTADTHLQIHLSEIPSFRDHDLFSQVHYLWKKASLLQNQLKEGDRKEGLKNNCECTADKSVWNPHLSDKMIILKSRWCGY